MRKILFVAVIGHVLSVASVGAERVVHPRNVSSQSVVVYTGTYVPLYGQVRNPVKVAAFRLDRYAVTRAQFAAFVAEHAEWRRGAVKAPGYLSDWPGATNYGDASDAARPVTNVTQQAAAAYCRAQDKRLPTIDEWEYAAAASPTMRDGSNDPAFKQMLMSLYTRSRPAKADRVGSQFRNAYGVNDMHGLIWEWVAPEMQSSMQMRVAGAPRHRHDKHDLSCAGSANGAADATNFAAFLRYAFRSGLNSSSTSRNLGFRCAGDI